MKRAVAAAGFVLFFASVSIAAPPNSPEYRARVAPQITEQMSKAGGPVSAIVTLWDQEVTKPSLGELRFESNVDAYVAEANRTVDEALRVAGITTPKHRYQSFAGFSADLTPYQIERLVDSPLVRMISPDWPMVLHRKEGNAIMTVPAVHALGKKGAGVSVAVIDDGVDYTHPELGGGTFPNSLVVDGYDFVDDVKDPSPAFDNSTGDYFTHGTSVSGIIAGQGDPSTGATGVAPQAKIVAFRARSGGQVLAAYDYIATHATGQTYPPIKVVNMSFAFDDAGFFSSNCDSESGFEGFKSAFDRLNALGIVLVASSGNEAKTNGVALPGCMSKVVAVGAVYDANIGGVRFPDTDCTDSSTAADMVTCYSNSSSFVALLAPSHKCRTTKAGSGRYDNEFGGTSAAAPYTSGAFAVLASAFPGRTPQQYLDIFRSTGKSITDPKSGRTTPRVDLNAAYQALAGGGGGTKSNVYFVPASARVAGGSAFFQTDARIFNKSTSTANVEMCLLDKTDNSTAACAAFTVSGSQARAIDDVIATAMGMGSGVGALLIASDQPLVITSDTYALNAICPAAGGTMGQYIPAVAINRAGTSQRIYHVINDARFYTNFGVLNASNAAAAVNVTVKSGTGGTLGSSMPIALGPYGWRQISRFVDAVGGGSTSNAYIEVTSNVPVISYTSVLDRKTADPFFVLGEAP